jgi:hypothetical protein
MRALAWMGLGSSVAWLLGAAAPPTGAAEAVRAGSALEIMSPDRGDCTLGLEWPWGAMAVKHVLFEDHRGPFKAVVESTGTGVRVRFEGWGGEPFGAVADKEVRIISWVASRKEVEFTAEATTAGEVRVRPAGHPGEVHRHGTWRAGRPRRREGLGRREDEVNPIRWRGQSRGW